VFLSIFFGLKRIVHPKKLKFCYHLLTLMLFQNCNQLSRSWISISCSWIWHW